MHVTKYGSWRKKPGALARASGRPWQWLRLRFYARRTTHR